MTKQPGTAGSQAAPPTILSIGAVADDDLSLQSIGDQSSWKLLRARDLAAAIPLFKKHNIAVVLCERDLKPGSWVDMLDHLRIQPNGPALIVTSRLADENLWAEALNLGAWDVLAKPFDRAEVSRTVMLAWLHWLHDGTAVPLRWEAAS